MADDCTGVTTIEELTICCRWVESGVPEEHFIEIILLKKANAESIYSALVEYCREKNIQLGRHIGMGFDGAATFSGDKTGIQRRLKELSPHALFVHCHCHVLQLASVKAANATPGIKHVYTTLMMLWKFFHYSPKRAELLNEIQKVLDLPELKIGRSSDTCWIAYERCVKAVKASYSSLVLALENIYETSHEPEALGLSKALSSYSTISDSSKISYPAGLDPPQKMCYQPSVFLIPRKCPGSLLMSDLYMETVQFKLSLDSLGEIYLNYWKELNLRRQPLSF